ncbi:molybdate ABC transporter permease subunit [Aquifex aeolicus]|uniref:Molybdenum transport system permease n=1 Tax=Aquifex aeolicus (strain VF5) TaxID=224324 RepID=O66497_AQUAE|nr:molybdate ABC transporter permease subunit [Aquifex aeolicus]AAC06461.1 Molybdenum transport system permease [Aquifex aeolicus VF5]
MKEALFLSLKLSFFTTLILLLISLVLSPLLAFKEFKGKSLVVALVTLPLVLPPTVLGFYLILLFSPESPFGKLVQSILGKTLLFSFEGLVVASVIYSLPLAVLPLTSAMEKIPKELIYTSYVFGYGKVETFFRVILPLSLNGLITSVVMSFANTMGEFGVVLMVGGNIPGETQTLSIFIYDAVQALDYKTAHRASVLLVGVSLLVMFIVLKVRGRVRVDV